MKRVCVKVIACLMVAALSAGHGLAKEPPQPMTIQLNWVANVEFAGILLAKERGWYKDAGIDLTLKEWKKGISIFDEVTRRNAQIGVNEGARIISAKAEGMNIRAFATQFQKSPYCLISKRDRKLETPEHLKGKRIGVKSSGDILMTKIVLGSAGLTYDDVTPVNIGWGDMPLLFNDAIDVYAGYMNAEPFIMKEKGYDVSYIPAFKHGYDFYSAVFFATDKTLQNQAELIRKFLEVTLRGWEAADKDPEGVTRLVVEKYYAKGSIQQQLNELKIFQTLAKLGEGRKFFGWMEAEYWTKGIDILYNHKQIEKRVHETDIFTPAFLKAIYFGK